MTGISVIIPVVRPEKAGRCVAAIEPERGRIGEAGIQVEVLIEEDRDRIGCPTMVKRLVEQSRFDLVMFLGDDTIPQPGCIEAALRAMETLPDGWGVVGLNDGRNDGNRLMTHWMADKRMLPICDGEFFHTGYHHCFCDRELLLRAQLAARYLWAQDARIIHDHPDITGAPMDEDYRKVYSMGVFEHDRWLFYQRSQMLLSGIGKLRLNLGSGVRKLWGWVNIDNREEVVPDICRDVLLGLPYGDSSVDEVRAFDFLEHIPNGCTAAVIEEIWRVLKPGGRFEHFTPSTDGRGAFQDPTHQSFWNANSWKYFMLDEVRSLYGIQAKFAGRIRDIVTDEANRIVHTYGIFYAVKG